jgi:spermidine/putrescine transport system permease protein
MKNWIKVSYLTVVYGFLYLPIAVLVFCSFNASRFSTQWQGFTWAWYQQLLTNHHLMQVTLHSIILGITSATAATILGSIAAICLYRYRFLGQRVLYLLNFVLIISPEIVMAVSLLLFFSWINLPSGFLSLLLAHTTFCMPFVTITIYTRLLGIDANILKAATELGASEFRVFYQILLPLIQSNILAGWLLSFTLSLDDFILSFFLSGPEFSVLPLEVYSWVRLGIKPELNALCSILLCLTLGLVLISQILLNKKHD